MIATSALQCLTSLSLPAWCPTCRWIKPYPASSVPLVNTAFSFDNWASYPAGDVQAQAFEIYIIPAATPVQDVLGGTLPVYVDAIATGHYPAGYVPTVTGAAASTGGGAAAASGSSASRTDAIIAGSVVGGVVAIGVLAAALLAWKRYTTTAAPTAASAPPAPTAPGTTTATVSDSAAAGANAPMRSPTASHPQVAK